MAGDALAAIAKGDIPRMCRREMRRMSRRPTSSRSPAEHDDLDRLEHDQEVQANRRILDVEKVVLQFFARVSERVTVLVLHLRPTRNPWTHRMPHAVIRNLFAE